MYTLKKSLGQHFLHDENISRKIVEELASQSFERLLEIGPGGGALTKYLIRIPGIDFKCVEVDEEKVTGLIRSFPELKEKIIHKSILEMDIPFSGSFTIVGNFPYNISTQIIFKILEWKASVDSMVGMFQKEVAQRIASVHGNKVFGILSVLVQAFFSVDYLFEVNANSFTPPPKVKSAVIRFTRREIPLPMKSERSFFVLVKTAFNQRRKTLRNGVRSLFDTAVLDDTIFSKRAEQLSVEEFGKLTFSMK